MNEENISVNEVPIENGQESEGKKNKVYSYCGKDETVLPMLWRAAFLAKICGITIPDDIEVFQLDEDTKVNISAEKYSEALSHLLILFGAGYVDAEMVEQIASKAAEYSNIITETEDFAIAQCNEAIENQVEEKFIKNALMCVINSQEYENIHKIDFETARRLCEDTYATIRKGFVYITNADFLKFYADAGEPMGLFDSSGSIRVQNKEQILNGIGEEKGYTELIAAADENNQRPNILFCLNLDSYFHIKELYGKPYGVEFIKYAKTEGIPFDENYYEKYEEYVRKNKMQLSVSSVHKKRSVCGGLVNWFDYCNARYIGDKLELSEGRDITKIIDLTSKYSRDDDPDYDTLAKRAAEEFLAQTDVSDNSVIEVMHGDDRSVFLYKEKQLEELDKASFRIVPFNYSYIWSVIMEWSRRRLIKKSKDSVEIPVEEWDRIVPAERKYARRLIEEQYSLKNQGNKMLQKLSDLRTQAEDDKKEADGIQADKDKYKAEQEEKKTKRPDNIEE